jgi:hypothetical protein
MVEFNLDMVEFNLMLENNYELNLCLNWRPTEDQRSDRQNIP